MYAEHFGFRLLPFENVPDPVFFFDKGEYQRVLRRLVAAVHAGRGLMVVAGPIGSGKTTISQKLMEHLPEGTVHLWLAEPAGTDRELFQMLLERLGESAARDSRVLALGALRDRLLALQTGGGRFLLIVDESHKLTDEALEAVRLLNNLEQGSSKLVQVLLLGQDELAEMLTRPGREAFRQRIANFETLGRMTGPQVRDYVRHRVRVAGGDPGILPEHLLDAVAAAAEGIPRLTNSLCDRALLHAFEGRRSSVGAEDLLRAAEEVGVYRKAFHFLVGHGAGGSSAPAAAAHAADQPSPAAPQPQGGSQVAAAAPVRGAAPVSARVAPRRPAAARPAEAAPRRLAGPILLLAGGIAALAASLAAYCVRATAVYGGDCLAHLLRDLLP